MNKLKSGIIATVCLSMLLLLGSCCKTCKYGGYDQVVVCRDQFSSDADYQNELYHYDQLGYECK